MASYVLENQSFHISIDPESFTFSVVEKQNRGIEVHNAFLGVKYRRGPLAQRSKNLWDIGEVGWVEESDSVHGKLQTRTLKIGPDKHGLAYSITFALPEAHPLVLWQMRIENQGKAPVKIERLDFFRVGYLIYSGSMRRTRKNVRGSLILHSETGDTAFYSQGWQSWSYTGVYDIFDRYKKTRLGPIRKMMNINPDTPHRRAIGQFGSDMFGVFGDRTHGRGVLLGFLSQKQHFGSLEAIIEPIHTALRMWANGDNARLDPGATLESDWACLQPVDLKALDPLAPYLEAVAREHGIAGHFDPGKQDVPVGWCSWYEHFTDISEDVIAENIQTAAKMQAQLPLDIIQIDDGFQTETGDWLSHKDTFPNGLTPLTKQIKEKGYTPGLWLAPFAVSPRSQVVKEHRDWLLRGKWGPANAGFLPQWGGFANALDLTQPEALDYVREVVRTAVNDWGFDYLKLDFLYAAALQSKYQDETKTRAQVLRAGLQAIRAEVGDEVTLLGCGCPLGPAIGLVDAMRISTDVEASWHPQFNGIEFFFKHEPDMPAASLAIHNTLTRAFMHRRWWFNDPDCLLLRPDAELTMAEIHTLATVIALSGGSLLLSDDLPNLPPERLGIAQALLPVIAERLRVVDWFSSLSPSKLRLDLEGPAGAWNVLAHINWSDKAQDFNFYPGEFGLYASQDYFVREFWSGQTQRLTEARLTFPQVPPHGVVLLAVRPAEEKPTYLGGGVHISQGLEVTSWERPAGGLEIGLQAAGQVDGVVDLYLPKEVKTATLDGGALELEACGDHVYRFAVAFDKQAILRMQW
ncbi:MAG: alpha-galactosidase [Anaerolineales bacterium]|nr:alpha-galactosidase [Anaerolineales bacterium]